MITNLRPIRPAGAMLAQFDVQVCPTVKLLNWTLKRTTSGFRVFPPTPRHGMPTAIVEPALMAEIGRQAAEMYLEGDRSYDAAA